MPRQSKRSKAAKLGWARKRALHEKRSKAAKLGWKHRREREQFERRSKAAKKGWKTRKKKEAPGKPDKKEFVDWVDARNAMLSERDIEAGVTLEFDALGNKYSGSPGDFPQSEIRKSLEDQLDKYFDYWNLVPIFVLERWLNKEKTAFVRMRISLRPNWKETREPVKKGSGK